MERWLVTFLLGAILSLFLPIVPALFHVFLSLFIFSLFLHFKNIRFIAGLFLGIAWMLWHACQYSGQWQVNGLDKKTFSSKPQLVYGKVASLPSQTNGIARFNFLIDRLDDVALNHAILIRLRWDKVPTEISQGQQWQIKIKVKPAHGLANSGGFSYQTWLRQKNILATGYVVGNTEHLLLNDYHTLRQQWLDKFESLLPSHPLSSLMLALGFGERSQISSQQWAVLKATGTQHLIAISGLHLGLVASFSFFSCLLIFRYLPLNFVNHIQAIYWLNNSNARLAAICFSCLITLLYAYLAGFSVPTVRAIIMLLLYWGLRILGIKITPTRGILLALFFVVIIEPFNLFSASFWLSFYAVVLIFFILWRFSAALHAPKPLFTFLKTLLLIQFSLSVLMLPIVAFFSQQISLASLFANIFAVPFMSITCIPLCLIAAFTSIFNEQVSSFFVNLSVKTLDVIWQWLLYLSKQSWSLVDISHFQMIFIAITVVVIVIISITTSRKRRVLVLASALAVISVFQFNKVTTQGWQVSILDVGQGLAIAIEKNQHMLLYDTGASFPSGFNMAEAVIIPYMRHQGISKLDHLIISHSDNDHAGGLPILIQQAKIEHLIANDAEMLADDVCSQGQVFIWQQLEFRVLWPTHGNGDADDFGRQKNDQSCVIQISDGHHSVLLTGDISSKVESFFVNEKVGRSTVLIAPHHGSKSSSSNKFLQNVNPKFAIFSSGYLNRWHMPSLSVLKRYQSADVKHYSTSESGMIRLLFSEENITVKTYREDIWPHWFAN